MSKIVKVRLTEYYPFHPGLSEKAKKMEGGILDRKGKPLYSLEDYMEGKAPYVSLACDYLGGPPGNVKEFRTYGAVVWLPDLSMEITSYVEPDVMTRMIYFRLVDTGGHFFGDSKVVKVAGYEPIDVCRREKPPRERSFSGMLTEMWLNVD